MDTYRQLSPPDTRGQVTHDLNRTLGSDRRSVSSRKWQMLIDGKNFDHLSCATRPLVCLVANFAPAPKRGENFGTGHYRLNPASTPHFKDAT
jgi:hypothetical protein